MTRRQLTLGLMLVTTFLPLPSGGATAAPQPATSPATRPTAALDLARRLIAQLADADYDRREAARVALMDFRRADLPSIREAVRQALPLAPSQLTVLRDIVTHVYLSGDVYLADPSGAGFLGVSLPVELQPEDQGLFSIERGVAVTGRVPGFPAYRLLQNGDVLVCFVHGDERVDATEPRAFRKAIGSIRAGQTLTFEVLRRGRTLTVPITLQPRPAKLEFAFDVDEFVGRRADAADEFWLREFAPLLDGSVS